MELKFSGGVRFFCLGSLFVVAFLFPVPISKGEMFMKAACMPDCSVGSERLTHRLVHSHCGVTKDEDFSNSVLVTGAFLRFYCK